MSNKEKSMSEQLSLKQMRSRLPKTALLLLLLTLVLWACSSAPTNLSPQVKPNKPLRLSPEARQVMNSDQLSERVLSNTKAWEAMLGMPSDAASAVKPKPIQ